MRRILPLIVFCLLLALPSLADAGRKPKPPPAGERADGTLEITNGRGQFQIRIRGSFIGYVRRGLVVIVSKDRKKGDNIESYSGRRIRFRELDGVYRVQIVGVGVDLSAVGRGRVTMRGDRRGKTGTYSLNGEDPQPIPRRLTTLQLSAP